MLCALSVSGIRKSFGGNLVLDNVDFELRQGEVHALLGENGAGKSTLMNILTGIYAADSGTVTVYGEAVTISSPADALRLGIGMVHQHFRLIKSFTARENIRLSAGSSKVLRRPADCDVRIQQVITSSGLDAPLDVPVAQLSIADQQRVEILKALTLGARILILDEPTAVLTDSESESLLVLLRELARTGYGVIFITHKMREVMQAGDRVTTMREGRATLSGCAIADVDNALLSESMMGSQPIEQLRYTPHTAGARMLELSGVSIIERRKKVIDQLDLEIHSGEIVGIAGVGGNGQQELAAAIVGLLQVSQGQVLMNGVDITGSGLVNRRDAGVRFIPSDRASLALALNTSVNENLAATAIRTGELGRILSGRRVRAFARSLIESYDIAGVTGKGNRPIRLLSGGNAQKAVLARELDDLATLLVAHSPTRGLDVAACRYVHDRLTNAAARGCAILVISEDLEEILALSDRIYVMNRGKLLSAATAKPDRLQIGSLMLGHA